MLLVRIAHPVDNPQPYSMALSLGAHCRHG